MSLSKIKLKELEKRIWPNKEKARLYFSIGIISDPEDGQTEEEYIKDLWALWLKAGYPKDLEKFSKALWVRAPKTEGDTSIFGPGRLKEIKQRVAAMYQIVKEIIKDK